MTHRRRFLQIAGAAAALGSTRARAAPASTRSEFSLDQFGGKGSGSVDESLAFAKALSAGTGRRVVVPAGTWRFDRTIVIPDRTHLELSTGAMLVCRVADGGPAIRVHNGAKLVSAGGGSEVAQIIGDASCHVSSIITNADHRGAQEFAYLEGLFVTAHSGARIDTALVDLVSVFANSAVRDCVLAGNATAPIGLRIAGSDRTGFGPLAVDNVWVTRSREHNIVITDAPTAGGSATCWLTNITSENQGSGGAGLVVRGTGGLFNVNVRNFHYEHGLPVSTATPGIRVDGVPGFTLDGADILAAEHAHKTGIEITPNPRNTGIRVHGVRNLNGLDPILEDAANRVRIGARDIGLYEAGGTAEQTFVNLVHMAGGVATLTKSGPITDADFSGAPDGTLAVDTRASRFYVRVAGAWKSVALT